MKQLTKTTKKALLFIMSAILFMLCIAFCVNTSDKRKAHALTPNYNYVQTDTIYYFSDSAHAFKDKLTTDFGGENVIYDICPMMTSGQLAYLLYTGYFWGFNTSVENTVIIEIKTTRPDVKTLENLFACLKAQNCTVMYISPYASDITDDTNVDVIMEYPRDKYARFVRNSVASMMDENGYLRNNSALLLDGRFVELRSPLTAYYRNALCANSTTLRKILLYLYYGCDSEREAEFEWGLYEEMWKYYFEVYLQEDNSVSNPFTTEEVNIDAYIALWQTVDEGNEFDWQNRWQTYLEGYDEAFEESVGTYYTSIITDLQVKNTHLLIYVEATYVDLLQNNVPANNSLTVYTFYDATLAAEYTPFFDWLASPPVSGEFNMEEVPLPSPIEYLYAMGIWYLPQDYYNLLQVIQNVIDDAANGENTEKKEPDYNVELTLLNNFPIYLWLEDPLNEGDGLRVMLEDTLEEAYGEPVAIEEDPEVIANPEILEQEFETLLWELLYA